VTKSQKAAFTAGVVAAIVGAGAILRPPPSVQSGTAAGARAPVLLTPLQRLLFERGEELEYRIAINGVPAGSLRSVVSSDEQDGQASLVLEYMVQTAPTLSKIWRFSASGRSVMKPGTLLPRTSESTTLSRDREKKVSTTFDRQTGIATVTEWDSDTGETKRKEVRFDLGLDVPAALLFVRISKMPLGRPRKLTVLKGDDRYEATFTAVGTGPVEVEAGAFDAIEVELQLRKLPDEREDAEQGKDGYREVRLWLSRQGRVPLKIESPILGGKLRAELVGPPAAFTRLRQ